MGGYGGSRCRELVCALAMWISLRHSVSLFLTLPMDQTNYFDLKCSNLKCHHDSELLLRSFAVLRTLQPLQPSKAGQRPKSADCKTAKLYFPSNTNLVYVCVLQNVRG